MLMDPKSIESEISKNLLREGMLKKRSKFLKEWRDRWVVLTTNFLFTFSNKKREEMTDVLEIKDIEGIKSYLKKTDDMGPNGFKVESSENTLVLMAKDKKQKWSWIVLLERLCDYKMSKGTSECSSFEDVKNMGFRSMNEYEMNEKQEEVKTQNQEEAIQKFEDLKKMVELFKSQDQQILSAQAEVKEVIEKIAQENAQSEQVKQLKSKAQELFGSQNYLQTEGIIKGILIARKLKNQNRKELETIISLLADGCKSERMQNWMDQLKEQL